MSLLRLKKISCPGCGDTFRIADDASRALQLPCPSCGYRLAETDNGPGSEVISVRERAPASCGSRAADGSELRSETVRKQVAFRCARQGLKFTAWFVRRGASDLFVLDEIEKLIRAPSITDLFRRRRPSNTPASLDDIDRFDFTGWACPYCNHGHAGLDGAFFACSCGELICGGRSRRTLLGATIYKCHSGCGVEGRASGPIGKIKARSSGWSGVSIVRSHVARLEASTTSSSLLLPKK